MKILLIFLTIFYQNKISSKNYFENKFLSKNIDPLLIEKEKTMINVGNNIIKKQSFVKLFPKTIQLSYYVFFLLIAVNIITISMEISAIKYNNNTNKWIKIIGILAYFFALFFNIIIYIFVKNQFNGKRLGIIKKKIIIFFKILFFFSFGTILLSMRLLGFWRHQTRIINIV